MLSSGEGDYRELAGGVTRGLSASPPRPASPRKRGEGQGSKLGELSSQLPAPRSGESSQLTAPSSKAAARPLTAPSCQGALQRKKGEEPQPFPRFTPAACVPAAVVQSS